MTYDRRKPGNVFRKSMPSETRENWALVKEGGRKAGRYMFTLIALPLIAAAMFTAYAKGYFDGTQAVRHETKESN